MTTTYILHGGETSRNTPDNDLFFKYFTHFVDKDEVRILMCYFAKEKNIWDSRLESDKNKIARQTTKKVSVSLAQNADDLLEKMDSTDVLYVAGGDAEAIEAYLPALKNLQEKIRGKVYLGCSMGAFIISSHYVLSFEKQAESEVHHGLGLLPISTLCHWDIEKKKELKVGLLRKAASDKPILALDECKLSLFIH